jgi:hypothetical protein
MGGEGVGRSKRRAESEAARSTLADEAWQRALLEGSGEAGAAREDAVTKGPSEPA